MDRVLAHQHLAQAERHVAEGKRHIAEQRARIADAERDGRDTTLSKDLLRTFEQTQELHIADRDRILAELTDETGELSGTL